MVHDTAAIAAKNGTRAIELEAGDGSERRIGEKVVEHRLGQVVECVLVRQSGLYRRDAAGTIIPLVRVACCQARDKFAVCRGNVAWDDPQLVNSAARVMNLRLVDLGRAVCIGIWLLLAAWSGWSGWCSIGLRGIDLRR